MGRQPPALGADDNPPSPPPPPTPYTDPPTPLPMPDSPVAPPPRSLSPRLRPLRRLASRTRRRADGGTSTNSATPSPPPSASVNGVPKASQQSKNASTAPQETPPEHLQKPQTRSLAVRPPQPDAQSAAPTDPSALADNPPHAVSIPSEPPQHTAAASLQESPSASPPLATQQESKLSPEPSTADTPTVHPMIVDTDVEHQAQPEKQSSPSQTEPPEHSEQPPKPSQSHQAEGHNSPSREEIKPATPASPTTRSLALSDSALHSTTDKPNSTPSEPAPAAASITPPEESTALASPQADEVMRDVDKQTSPESGVKDKPYVSSPPNTSAHLSVAETETQVNHEITATTTDKPHIDQPTPSSNDRLEQQPVHVEVIDLADGPTQPTQASSKPLHARQLAVRSDFSKSERRQLAVRSQDLDDPPRGPYETPLDSSPDISKVFRSSSSAKGRKRLGSPEDFEMPPSRYGTRSAAKEREPVPTRSRTRRRSEPVGTLISERTRRRKKPEVRPVKGDKLRVLWHIDLLYYEGVVDSVLSYRGKQFYDVTYDSGEREYYLDLSTRKWRFADGRDGNDTDDSLPEPQELPDYSEFPKIGDKVVVMWHVDAKYYPGVVQDILKTSNGWFYDVDYEGGDREFFLDLLVRKWKYGSNESRKRNPRSMRSARRAPREKIKRAARKSTGGGSSAYIPPSNSSMDTGGSLGVVEATEHQPSRTLRKVESLLEEKERQEQERRAREEQKKKLAEERRMEAKRRHAIAQEREDQIRGANVPNGVEHGKEAKPRPSSSMLDSMGGVASESYASKPSSDHHPMQSEVQEEPSIVLDLPELEAETFENVMKDISAPLAPPSTKKRPRSPGAAVDDDEQLKRKKNISPRGKTQNLVLHEGIDTSSKEDLVANNLGAVMAPTNPLVQDANILGTAPSSARRPSSQHNGRRFPSTKQSHLPHNVAPPARKTVQQRARSALRTQLTSQHVLQSEPDFIPRPRSVSRARSRSRLPSSRRRTASPNSFMERRKFYSRDTTPPVDYSWMRPSSFLSQRRVPSARRTKTNVADIVSVSGLVAKRWIEENTKQLSNNLKSMENELNKMKVNHAKHMKTEKLRRNRATAQQSKRTSEPEMSDEEEDAVLGGVKSEFMGLIKKYRTVVEQREQVLMQQFAGFRRTLASQNSKLVLTGKQLEKLDIRGLEALNNLQPVTRKKLDIPPPVPPRAKADHSRAPAFNSHYPLLHQDAVQGQKPTGNLQEKHGDRADKSDAVAKSLRRKLADLVTRSDWLGEEVKRLQNRERSLVREKRDAYAELNKIRLEKSGEHTAMIPSGSRGVPTRSTPARSAQRISHKFAPSKPVGIVKNRSSMETRSSGRNIGKAPPKNLPLGNLNYRPPMPNAPNQSPAELKSSAARRPEMVPTALARSNLVTKPPPMPKPAIASKTFQTLKQTPMQDVTKPEVSALDSAGIDRGATFTDDVGKSMDKQAWELIALIFTIWLLQDEGRSEPPKEPGDRMDLWVRDCVGNCLKHARTYLDATSGITTARRSLMHDVDDENVYIEWILGESDGHFERARSNYALWEPTLLDIEWLAEKRVLIGLSICYKKAWGETSARQYETIIMYAKAIAHKAVSNFELYMPHTIVLGAPLTTLPSAAKTNSQLPAQRPTAGDPQDQPISMNKGPDLAPDRGAFPPAAGAPPIQDVVQPPNLTEAQPSLPEPSLPHSDKGKAKQYPTVLSGQVEAAKATRPSVGVNIITGTPVTVPLSQPSAPNTQSAVDPAGSPQKMATAAGSTASQVNVRSQEQASNATPSSGVASTAPSASRMEMVTGSSCATSQGTGTVAAHEETGLMPPAGAKENAVKELNPPKPGSQQPKGETEDSRLGGKDATTTGSAAITELKSSDTPSGILEASGLLPAAGTTKPVGSAAVRSQEANKESTLPAKPASVVNVHEAQASPNDTQGKRADPGVGRCSDETNEVQRGRAEESRNSDTGGNVQNPKGGKADFSSSNQSAVGAADSGIAANASINGSNEKATPVSSQATTNPQLSSTTMVTSMGANACTGSLTAPQNTRNDVSSLRSTGAKGTDQHGSQNMRVSAAGDLGHSNESEPGENQPVEGLPQRPVQESTENPIKKDLPSSSEPETTTSPTVRPRNEEDQQSVPDSGRALRSSKALGSRKVTESPLPANLQVPKTTSPPTRRGSRTGISKGSGARGRKQVKSTRKSTSGKSRASRTPAGRSKDTTKSTMSPRPQRKDAQAASEPSVPKTGGMIGLMRLPGASPTVPQTETRGFLNSSVPAETLTRQPVGMKRLPQMPAAPQRRILSGVDSAEFDSLPGPIPRRQGLKGVSDNGLTQSMPYTSDQQGNPYVGNGRWNSQQPVQRKGYKSLSLMPQMSQQGAPMGGQSASPFDARAVASPFEYNRTSDHGIANETRADPGHESGYHVVEQVDMMNPPTPAALSALDYSVEQVHREPLPSTTEFQERFDRGYDPYRSQIGHIMNTVPRDGFGVGRHVHGKDYGKR